MTLSRHTKMYLIFGIAFSLFAILFALLYHFKVIASMDIYLAVTYISFFVGLALFYNGAYNRERQHPKATAVLFIFGILFILASTIMLIYGFSTGMIDLF